MSCQHFNTGRFIIKIQINSYCGKNTEDRAEQHYV